MPGFQNERQRMVIVTWNNPTKLGLTTVSNAAFKFPNFLVIKPLNSAKYKLLHLFKTQWPWVSYLNNPPQINTLRYLTKDQLKLVKSFTGRVGLSDYQPPIWTEYNRTAFNIRDHACNNMHNYDHGRDLNHYHYRILNRTG